jgi:hypothetical protein
MERVLVLGAGKFGRKALRAFAGRARRIVVVDYNPAALVFADDDLIEPVCAEGITYLTGNECQEYDWIIPALPLHVAYAWLLARLKGIGIISTAVPRSVAVPGCFYAANGTVYATLSAHICPEDCPGPEDFCYLTGEEREKPLYRLLSTLHVDGYTTHLLHSRQLAPGIGGFSLPQLENLLADVAGSRLPGLVVSSCACHAVMSAFDFA